MCCVIKFSTIEIEKYPQTTETKKNIYLIFFTKKMGYV